MSHALIVTRPAAEIGAKAMSTRHLHLTRRGAVYYFRARLPRTLRDALGQGFLTVSLRTKEAVPARRMARGCSAALDRLEALLLNAPANFSPSRLQLRLVLEAMFNRILSEGETKRDNDMEGGRYSANRKAAPNLPENESEWTDEQHKAFWDWVDYHEEHPETEAEFREVDAKVNATNLIREDLDTALAAFGLSMERDTPQYEALARDATRVVARAYAIEAERWQGRYTSDQDIPSFVAQKYPLDSALLRTWTTRLNQDEAVFLSRTIDEVARDFARFRQEQGISPKTKSDDDLARRYFVDLIGDKQMQDLTPEDGQKFANQLLRVPRDYGKGLYRRMTPRQAIALADRLEQEIASAEGADQRVALDTHRLPLAQARRKSERLRKKTANKHLTFFTSLWRSPLVPRSLRVMNPFEGTLYKKRLIDTETARRGTRVPFTQDELKALFASTIWNGCRRPFHEEMAHQKRLTPWKYWCPLIALFSGLRREEVARLRKDDFDTSNGVWLLRIQATYDRRLKSKAAIREVPVHSTLIALGLRDFVDGLSSKAPLFPDLRPTGAYKEYGEQLGKWFRTYRQTRGLYSPHADFHSFRHSFVSGLRDAGVAVDLIALLVGHEYGGVTASVYGRQVSILQKKDAIEKLDLSGCLGMRPAEVESALT